MKSLTFKLLPYIILIFIFISCKKEAHLSQIETSEISELSDSGVFFNGNITTNNLSAISEFGFVWSTDANFSLSGKKSIKTNLKNGENSLYIGYSFVYGITYYVKAFIQINNSTIFGNIVSFVGSSLPDVLILKFLPEQGTWGDTISIYGKNFNSEINKITSVKVGNTSTSVLSQNDSIIKVIIPNDLNLPQSFFSIITEFDTILSIKPIKLLAPEITDFSPTAGERGTELVIKGKYFNPDINYNSIKIGSYNAPVKTAGKDELTTLIPQEMTENGFYDVSVLCGNQTAVATDKYNQIEPWTELGQGQVLVYHGTSIDEIYFTLGTKCYVGSFNYFERRLGTCSNYISEFNPDTNNGENMILWYLYNSQWDISIFTDDNNIYLKRFSSVCEVDTVSKTLIIKNNFPGNTDSKSIGFSLNKTGFIYTANNELWSYNSFDDSWSQKQNIPNGVLIKNMVINDLWYILYKLQDNSFDFYTYDATSNTWSLINHYSSDDPQMTYLTSGSWVGYDSKGYCLTNYINEINQPELFIYNPITKIWHKRIGPFNYAGNGELEFGFNNYIYAKYENWISGEAYNYYLWKYDINNLLNQ